MQEPAENIDHAYRRKEEVMIYAQVPQYPALSKREYLGSGAKLTGRAR